MSAGRQASCVGKQRYITKSDARGARRRTPGNGGSLHIYRCTFCGFYHLGHLPVDVLRGRTEKPEWKRRRGA